MLAGGHGCGRKGARSNSPPDIANARRLGREDLWKRKRGLGNDAGRNRAEDCIRDGTNKQAPLSRIDPQLHAIFEETASQSEMVATAKRRRLKRAGGVECAPGEISKHYMAGRISTVQLILRNINGTGRTPRASIMRCQDASWRYIDRFAEASSRCIQGPPRRTAFASASENLPRLRTESGQ